jgi:two-component system NtrC family sensor kinase
MTVESSAGSGGCVEAAPFPADLVALITTFAEPAVIAIENVRLFTELQTRNEALASSLDQQTATSNILRAISRSPTDLDPVFETIVETAARLLGANRARSRASPAR